MLKQLQQYIQRLDQDVKCDDATYKFRLETCEQCEKNVNGMCGFCGCFILVRAIKKQMQCPNPKKNLWDSNC